MKDVHLRDTLGSYFGRVVSATTVPNLISHQVSKWLAVCYTFGSHIAPDDAS